MFSYTGTGVAFSLFGLEVRWYAIFIVTGMLLASALAAREAKFRSISSEDVTNLAIFALPAGIVGARLWYVIFEWHRYALNPLSALNIRNGGLAIQGGIMAALVVGFFYCRKKSIPFWRMADLIVPVLALAQSIGRWGNFTNNEAYGGPTTLPWALVVHGQHVHPTFLYESIGDFLIFIFLWWYGKYRLKKDGTATAGYLILYGLLRFFVEGLRTDSLYFGTLRVAQVLALIGVFLGILIFVLRRRESVPSHEPFHHTKIKVSE